MTFEELHERTIALGSKEKPSDSPLQSTGEAEASDAGVQLAKE